MGTSVVDVEFPVELERRLTTFDEALSELEDILKNVQKVPYSDVCAQVVWIVFTSKWGLIQRCADANILGVLLIIEIHENHEIHMTKKRNPRNPA